ncbi:hypothetical protein EVAR_41371_1 [Eumeta japonica]|uniref:Uncharacterized protein n=1 Tax=Eumeta variegata TaxID=151549 RepID=A0A4C1XRW5_EUMVA|nr:hypothetical protein EVAR_41371_1 [Eumeta japonica]
MSGIEIESGMESRIENGAWIKIKSETGTEIANGTRVENECGIKSTNKLMISDARVCFPNVTQSDDGHYANGESFRNRSIGLSTGPSWLTTPTAYDCLAVCRRR